MGVSRNMNLGTRFGPVLVVAVAVAFLASACSSVAKTDEAAPTSIPFTDTPTTSVATSQQSDSTDQNETSTSEQVESTTTSTTIPCDSPATTNAYTVFGAPVKLNIRSGAGTTNGIVGEFEPGARDIFFTADCALVGTTAWWKLASGEGWVASPYVKPQGNSICPGGGFSSQSVSDLNAIEAEVDGDGRIDTVYTFVRDGELTVAAELGDGGYIETAYVEDDTDFFFGYPSDLINIRAVKPAGQGGDILLADSSNGQFYMFAYRLCELPLIGGLETDGPFSFVQLNSPELSQRLVCTIEADGTHLYMHRYGSDVGGEELLGVKFDNTYHGASTSAPIPINPDGVYWAC